MPILRNKTQNKDLLTKLKVAKTFSERSIGLIGTKSLAPQEGLWIQKCRAIHTFFMSIPIDVIYIDNAFVVRKLQSPARPWRSFMPVLSASSVIELAEGQIAELNIQLGDQLYVGD